jgi:hypothetical protein
VIKAIKITKRSRNWDIVGQTESSKSPERNQVDCEAVSDPEKRITSVKD